MRFYSRLRKKKNMLTDILIRVNQAVFFMAFLLVLPAFASAAVRPDAGTVFGTLQENKLRPAETGSIDIKPDEEKVKKPEPIETKIWVAGIRIVGQKLFKEEQLQELVQEFNGKKLTLGELEEAAKRISRYFHQRGYLLADAVIPAQEVRNGIVEIAVTVGQYGKIDIRNHSTLNTGILTKFTSDIKSGDYIQNGTLDRVLLSLNSVSGIAVKATLLPGAEPGTADLILDVSDSVNTNAEIFSDNWGNRFTGKVRTGFNLNINNLTGNGDMAGIAGLLTSGSAMDYYSFSYLFPASNPGNIVDISYSRMHYLLGGEFAGLNANGIAESSSVSKTFVLERSRSHNLYVRIGYDWQRLFDCQGAAGFASGKRSGVWTFGLSGDSRDRFSGGGENRFALVYSYGLLSMKTPDAETGDAIAQTAGSFSKVKFTLQRVQYVADRLMLHLDFTGQIADKNLDTSEKLYLGGANAVRAYPQGEASGDEGYLFSGELRWAFPKKSFQLAAYLDHGRVTINKKPWDLSSNSRGLTGGGLGFIFNRPGDYSIRLDCAWKIAGSAAKSDTDRNEQFWLQAVKYL